MVNEKLQCDNILQNNRHHGHVFTVSVSCRDNGSDILQRERIIIDTGQVVWPFSGMRSINDSCDTH